MASNQHLAASEQRVGQLSSKSIETCCPPSISRPLPPGTKADLSHTEIVKEVRVVFKSLHVPARVFPTVLIVANMP